MWSVKYQALIIILQWVWIWMSIGIPVQFIRAAMVTRQVRIYAWNTTRINENINSLLHVHRWCISTTPLNSARAARQNSTVHNRDSDRNQKHTITAYIEDNRQWHIISLFFHIHIQTWPVVYVFNRCRRWCAPLSPRTTLDTGHGAEPRA